MIVELLTITPEPERLIEKAGRVAWASHGKMNEESAGPFIRRIVNAGHESVLEHASATVSVSGASRAWSHQMVRHRIGVSFTQRSQRYVSEDGFKYVTPPSLSGSEVVELCGFDVALDETTPLAVAYATAMEFAKRMYKKLQGAGIPNQDARFVLPNACETEITITANFREWRHILKLRGDPAAQWEIREMAVKVLKLLKPIAPNVFWDMEVDEDKCLIRHTSHQSATR